MHMEQGKARGNQPWESKFSLLAFIVVIIFIISIVPPGPLLRPPVKRSALPMETFSQVKRAAYPQRLPEPVFVFNERDPHVVVSQIAETDAGRYGDFGLLH